MGIFSALFFSTALNSVLRPPSLSLPSPDALRFFTQNVSPCSATRYFLPSNSSSLIGMEYHLPLFLPLTTRILIPPPANPSLPEKKRNIGFAIYSIIQLDLWYFGGCPSCFRFSHS